MYNRFNAYYFTVDSTLLLTIRLILNLTIAAIFVSDNFVALFKHAR